MTPNDALKFADTFNKPFDNPDDRVIALAGIRLATPNMSLAWASTHTPSEPSRTTAVMMA